MALRTLPTTSSANRDTGLVVTETAITAAAAAAAAAATAAAAAATVAAQAGGGGEEEVVGVGALLGEEGPSRGRGPHDRLVGRLGGERRRCDPGVHVTEVVAGYVHDLGRVEGGDDAGVVEHAGVDEDPPPPLPVGVLVAGVDAKHVVDVLAEGRGTTME